VTELLENYIGGQWSRANDAGTELQDPVLGTGLVRVSNAGVDLPAAFAYARGTGGATLRALSFAERAKILSQCVSTLKANRDQYFEIAQSNSGTTKADSSIDIDGAIFTLGYYAKLGAALSTGSLLGDGNPVDLSKDGQFKSRHVMVPTRGMALLINAFNFPAWGMWEKLAPALLSGVPAIVKPASSTAWLAQRMIHDIVNAGVVPGGALSIVCGSSAGLLDQLNAFDLLSFTGSADTAELIRSHKRIQRLAIRCNIESDSVNSTLLAPGEAAGSDSFSALVAEVVKEMTSKSGQKCTAIRRIFVHKSVQEAFIEALSAALSAVPVGNPRTTGVRMGSLVSLAQKKDVLQGIEKLKSAATLVMDGAQTPLTDADPDRSACVAPYLFASRESDASSLIHELEVFGPVATVIGYETVEEAFDMIRAGGGSLVCSIFAADLEFLSLAAAELASSHGRIHAVSPGVILTQTGHGNVMPMSIHGGPGRAGGGEELGGLRALGFFHRRAAIQHEAAADQLLQRQLSAWKY
jgi:3,4-dehydroadipyl-CoA semialdehyde dehydrogenase